MGYSADVAGTGGEVVQAYERQRYDVIFMDVQMPEMDGIEATQRIRDLERIRAGTPPTIIVAMTANAMLGDREKCLTAGMNDYLSKPVKLEAMQEVLLRWGPKCSVPSQSRPAGGNAGASASGTALGEASGQPLVDMQRLREFSADDDAAMRELAVLFVEQTGQQIAKLLAAHRDGNVEEVRRIAHSCAGGSVTCGMNLIGGTFRQIEAAATPSDFGRVSDPLSRVERQFAETKAFLHRHVITPVESSN